MDVEQRILVVDDEPVSATFLAHYLEEGGYLTSVASSGKEAWNLLDRQPEAYSVVLVDRMMPGVDGLEIVRRVKSDARMQAIPVIVQTGQAEKEEMIRALRVGAFDFIYKPVEPELLLPLVRRALG